mmetsp:Transcript_50159/g.125077  ORF Transcript_50159/g.125077 Transcript_50159/m.125077 type:complete len:350 (+) Transcript_50159:36-1085(+)
MDRAIWTAFHEGQFEPMLDCLTVRNMSFAREADGTTPLMAACSRGNAMVVQLLLDLQCDALAKDTTGLAAVDFAESSGHAELKRKILTTITPESDEQGRPVFTWDKCQHLGEDLHLDENQGYLVCTACGLILKENALQFDTDADGKPRKTVSIRGADSEYNEWRSQELDLADCMEKLGIVDNEEAKRRGKATSIWAKRDRALTWLDSRRRFLYHHASRQRGRQLQGADTDPVEMEPIDEYTEHGVFRVPMQKTLLHQGEVVRPRFKGNGQLSVECDSVDEDFIDVDSLRKQYRPATIRWTACKVRWERVASSVLQHERKHAAIDIQEEWLHQQGLLEEEREVEIEWEFN